MGRRLPDTKVEWDMWGAFPSRLGCTCLLQWFGNVLSHHRWRAILSSLRTAALSKNTATFSNMVSYWRRLRTIQIPEPNWVTTVGLFKVIPGSHKMPSEQRRRASRKVVTIRPNQALLLDGRLIIDWATTGGGIGLLKMIEKQGIRHYT